MDLDQGEVRQRLINYINDGIKMIHVSRMTGIPDYILCRYKKCEKLLYSDSLILLDDFLVSKGY